MASQNCPQTVTFATLSRAGQGWLPHLKIAVSPVRIRVSPSPLEERLAAPASRA
jgi:hypothetical protein